LNITQPTPTSGKIKNAPGKTQQSGPAPALITPIDQPVPLTDALRQYVAVLSQLPARRQLVACSSMACCEALRHAAFSP
jgi:hypothetical protein